MNVIQDFPRDQESYSLIRDNLIYNPYFKKVLNDNEKIFHFQRLSTFALFAFQIIILKNALSYFLFQTGINC